MKKLILVRHGQSEWNLKNLFTGWTDVDLTAQGVEEALNAGKTMKQEGLAPQVCFTSYLKRAIKTLNNILDAMDMDYLPVEKSWRLNEKSYGDLQGKNKTEAVEKFGEEQVLLWRRSFDVQSPALEAEDERSPYMDKRYEGIDRNELPLTESLQDCINRLMPFYTNNILKAFETNDTVLVVAHGNSLRGIVKTLKQMTNEEIIKFNIPTGIPYLFELNDDLTLKQDRFLADEETLKKLMEEVANQGKKK
ncbi:MAG: 2,3-diphosphoglycerate-dependent phosphoglycerate mutase [Bacteroidales bacterium]|jgi:2,3-bisphosphoglycerate-dependent phosphoglycerate mutase|nr:2,3-diphosphoglycerate-dependent phosphoglycerate mutase [Bacteroidales bacterium]MEE1097506.1 2,3-diphosphoglycerate-dependent phosphoglycerate mutase [Bacteroidales bacterium]